MDIIKVKKEDLMTKLRSNRDKHREMFLKAQEGYRQMVIEELEERLKDARDGKQFNTIIQLEAPVDQTKDYDRAIAMLEMDVDDHVELDQTEFSNYVLDDWHWKRQFTASNTAYFAKVGYNAAT